MSTEIGVGPAAEVPVPVNVTTCGLLAALSLTEMVAARVPVAVGLKTTVSVHEAPAAMERRTHWSSISAKSSGFRPACRIPLTNSDAVPVMVIVYGALVVPTSCAA
ncbi:MAG: hypothetical protein QOH72_891 [Solirubrobacteraceae bacterium]|jgi:hypothetical protein|nr:hypothetical protein [Solirubrobacteraceae bacterium]